MAVACYIAGGNGRSIHDISRKFNISDRTSYRILDRLQMKGYPLTNEELRRGKEKLWTMLRHDEDEYGNPLPSSEFTPEEELLLKYIIDEAESLSGVLPSFTSMKTKLRNLLARSGTAFSKGSLYAIETVESISKEAPERTAGIAEVIVNAIRNRKRCAIAYKAPGYEEASETTVSPIFCFFYEGGMYLQAIREDGDLRTYAIERIQEIRETEEKAAAPDFDPHILLSDPFGPFIGKRRIDADIWISRKQLPYIRERNWPSSVSIEEKEDGSAIFHVSTYGGHELLNWIRAQKDSVRILSPEWLKEQFMKELGDTLAVYKD